MAARAMPRMVLLWLTLTMAPWVSATTQPSRIFWRSETSTQPSGAHEQEGLGAIAARGEVLAEGRRPSIIVSFTNHTPRPIRLSYVADAYVGVTASGRRLPLTGEFLTYPSVVQPGEGCSVTLQTPKDIEPEQLAEIRATLNEGRASVTLKLVSPRIAEADAANGVPVVPAIGALSPPPPSPSSAPAAGSTPSPATPPLGTVPVVVEFHQDLGSALKLAMRWDALPQAITVASGGRQMFYAAPGAHELHLRSDLPAVARTEVHVPVFVGVTDDTRVVIIGHPRLSGVELRVQIWEGARLMSEQMAS